MNTFKCVNLYTCNVYDVLDFRSSKDFRGYKVGTIDNQVFDYEVIIIKNGSIIKPIIIVENKRLNITDILKGYGADILKVYQRSCGVDGFNDKDYEWIELVLAESQKNLLTKK